MKVGTDFSGLGSPEMALDRIGIIYDLIFASEIDKFARRSYNALHNPKTFYNDIRSRDHKEVPQLDLYVAGFPCQSFSQAGLRRVDDARGTLFYDVADFIRVNQPHVFLLENVIGLIQHDNGRVFQAIKDILSNGGGTINGQIGMDTIEDGLGYHIYYKVLNSKDYNIPQNRERVFIVGFKRFKEFRFPKPIQLSKFFEDVLEDSVDAKYNISEKLLKWMYKHKEKRGSNKANLPTKKISHCIPAVYGRMGADHPYTDKGGSMRRLTPLEAWRLQGFEDSEFYKVRKTNSDSQLYKQIGNSITCDVLIAIFKKIYHDKKL